MNLVLTDAQAHEMRSLLEAALREISHEIADTDNAQYPDNAQHRLGLVTRRRLLNEIADELGRLIVGATPTDTEVLVREMAHPGD